MAKDKEKHWDREDHRHCRKGFPILAVILLVIGIIWLLNSIGYFQINIPWVPVVLIVIAIGLIINRILRK